MNERLFIYCLLDVRDGAEAQASCLYRNTSTENYSRNLGANNSGTYHPYGDSGGKLNGDNLINFPGLARQIFSILAQAPGETGHILHTGKSNHVNGKCQAAR
jgi:hypothetical protein